MNAFEVVILKFMLAVPMDKEIELTTKVPHSAGLRPNVQDSADGVKEP